MGSVLPGVGRQTVELSTDSSASDDRRGVPPRRYHQSGDDAGQDHHLDQDRAGEEETAAQDDGDEQRESDDETVGHNSRLRSALARIFHRLSEPQLVRREVVLSLHFRIWV